VKLGASKSLFCLAISGGKHIRYFLYGVEAWPEQVDDDTCHNCCTADKPEVDGNFSDKREYAEDTDSNSDGVRSGDYPFTEGQLLRQAQSGTLAALNDELTDTTPIRMGPPTVAPTPSR